MTDVYCAKYKCCNNDFLSEGKKEFNLCCRAELEITRDGNCFDYDKSGLSEVGLSYQEELYANYGKIE